MMMSPTVAEQAGGDHVLVSVTTAVLAGDQMLGSGLQKACLSLGNPVELRKRAWIGGPHGLGAIKASSALPVEASPA